MNRDEYHHEKSGATLRKPIALPDVVAFEGVATLTEELEPIELGTVWKGQPSLFTGYAGLPEGRFANVRLTPEAENVLRDRAMGDLSFNLRVIDHGKGWALVTADYDRIIGSVWLAYVRTETLPAGVHVLDPDEMAKSRAHSGRG